MYPPTMVLLPRRGRSTATRRLQRQRSRRFLVLVIVKRCILATAMYVLFTRCVVYYDERNGASTSLAPRSTRTRRRKVPPPLPPQHLQESTIPTTTLHLLGERHSGTKWISQHLEECFGYALPVRKGLNRWKHWFQNMEEQSEEENAVGGTNDVVTDNSTVAGKRAVVVVMFRDVLQWVEAMRTNPYHSPSHFNLTWQQLVTKPWTLDNHSEAYEDQEDDKWAVVGNSTNESAKLCPNNGFAPRQVVPCRGASVNGILLEGTGRNVTPVYELRLDGSGRPYDNILQLRRDKVRHFLSLRNWSTVQAHRLVRYEDLVSQHGEGTKPLVDWLETVLNVPARCSPILPPSAPMITTYVDDNANTTGCTAVRNNSRPLSPDYVEYMRQNVDWETERLIGFDVPPPPLSSSPLIKEDRTIVAAEGEDDDIGPGGIRPSLPREIT